MVNNEMIKIEINGKTFEVPQNTTILKAASLAGFEIPHLCYLEGINEIGACRLCCVEVEGENRLVPACEKTVSEGMKITTDSLRIRENIVTNLQFILSQHNANCPNCKRNGNCQLQNLAKKYNLSDILYKKSLPGKKACEWNNEFPLIRDASKCIKCMRCIQICDKVQGLGIWDLTGAGSRTTVGVSNALRIEDSPCSLCGQCITHCPVGALSERNDVDKVLSQIRNKDKITVVQIAPAVRAAWGEEMGLPSEEATVKRMAGALRKAGFDYVFDTSFTADLTIMEEGSEFLARLKKGDLDKYPMFTSCCPGWVRFIKSQYPSLVKQLSTAKSPQQMFGSVIKSYFAKSLNVEPERICSVSIMPCTAKKAECDLPTMSRNGIKDVDYVLTTREVCRLIKSIGIDITRVEESEFDSLMGSYTGAGVIFGATGGVMEAALRSAYFLVTGKNPQAESFKEIRSVAPGSTVLGQKPWREASFDIAGTTVKVAVASSLGNARKLCDAILNGEVKYDFVEIMACPGGCAGGGGQIIKSDDSEMARSRGDILYSLDSSMNMRFSHENPDVLKLYEDELGSPLSEKAEELLHTDHFKA